MEPTTPTDSPAATVTVLDRFLAAHISEERALEHLRASRVKVDGVLVSDANYPAPKPAVVSLVAP